MESFSLYIHIFSRSQSFLTYVEKKLWGFKNLTCSQLVRNLKNLSEFFSLLKLTTRKIFHHKEIFFLFYVAKSISFEVISILKISTFAAALGHFHQLLCEEMIFLLHKGKNDGLRYEVIIFSRFSYIFNVEISIYSIFISFVLQKIFEHL